MRNEIPNYIEKSFNKNTEMVDVIKKATELFFDSIPETIFTNKEHCLKVFRNKENTKIYTLDKNAKEIAVYVEKIEDFQQDQKTEKYVKYNIDCLKKNNELYIQNIFNFSNNVKQEKVVMMSNEELFSKLEQLGEDGVAQVKNLKIVFKRQLKENPFFFSQDQLDKTDHKTTSELSVIQDYLNLLNEKKCLTTVYDIEFLKSLSLDLNKHIDKSLNEIKKNIHYLTKVCKEQKFKTYNSAFVFNDSDNNVWLKKDQLILTDQNCGFYFHIKDDDNFIVYFLEKEYKDVNEEIKRIDNGIKNNTLNDLKDICLKVENGKTVFSDSGLMYVLNMDLEFSFKAMRQDGYGDKQYPVDVYSYEYQKNYYYTKYGVDEFNFLAQAFLTSSGGFDYDKEKGALIDDSVIYLENIEVEDQSKQMKQTSFNYCCPKKISHLNEDWLKGLKYMVSVLKTDRPLPSVFEGDNPEDAVNKAIAYYDIKIAKLNTNKMKI